MSVVGPLTDFVDVVCQQRGAVVMGVLNVTPDSFFDGSRFIDARDAAMQIDRLLEDGADIIDVGPESSRPGAEPVPTEEQIRRALPAVEHAVERGAIVSIDTASEAVARAALRAGARIINDVSCLATPELARAAADFDATLVVMHSRGAMAEMPGFGHYPDDGYDDVVEDVRREWLEARDRAIAEGLPVERVWFDPGLGFHKSAQQSTETLRRLGEFADLNAIVCVGASRKSFLGKIDGSGPERRLGATIAACLRAVEAGAHIVRVHDVHAVRQALLTHLTLAPRSSRNRSSAPRGPLREVRHDA